MACLSASIAAAQVPSIEGTYQLISRTLPDGTVRKPPDVMGLATFTKTHRNYNIVSKDATGQFGSTSFVSTYKLTATEYTETILFRIMNNPSGGKGVVYDLSGKAQSVPVTVEAGRIQFQAPFSSSQRTLVFKGNTWTSTNAEGGMDMWEKVP
jgi:hypothetical protein